MPAPRDRHGHAVLFAPGQLKQKTTKTALPLMDGQD
jgi:hypothetical protein